MSTDKNRRLAAVVFTDIVGFSKLSQESEELAIELLHEHNELIQTESKNFGGKVIKNLGDGFLIEFVSAVEATRFSISMQTKLHERNEQVPLEKIIVIRIGIHVDEIFELGDDILGDGVNIASRIQSVSKPGGICLTKQVLDHLKQTINLPIEKMGSYSLKNIKKSTEVYQVIFSWQKAVTNNPLYKVNLWFEKLFAPLLSRIEPNLKMLSSNSLNILGVVFCLIFFVCIARTIPQFTDFSSELDSDKSIDSNRTLATTTKKSKNVSLLENWKMSKAKNQNGLSNFPNDASNYRWEEFSIQEPWKYQDKISGVTWFKTKFTVDHDFDKPTIVLGLIQGKHRVYINGKFIGGGNYYRELQYYSFDNSLLDKTNNNTLHVQVESKKSIIPGILFLPNVGSYIGEFEPIYNSVLVEGNIRSTHFNIVSLAVTIALLLICSAYYAFHRYRREYLYFSLFLLSSTMLLLYENMFVSYALDYQFYRYMKLIAIFCSSAFLFSSFLYLSRKYVLEFCNNILIFVAGLYFSYSLLSANLLPSDYSALYQDSFHFITYFSLAWLVFSLGSYALSLSEKEQVFGGNRFQPIYLAIVLLTGTLAVVKNYSATWTGFSFLKISRAQQDFISTIGDYFPIVFAITLIIVVIYEHIINSKNIHYRIKRDQLILDILRVVSHTKNLNQGIAIIQEMVCDFVEASRSTIYLWNNENEKKLLRANYKYGAKQDIQNISETVIPESGFIGEVVRSKQALLVVDMTKDRRIQKEMKTGENKYKTDSFMIFPIILKGSLMGVLTVSDKKSTLPFNSHDFFLMQRISSDIALIVKNLQNDQNEKKSA